MDVRTEIDDRAVAFAAVTGEVDAFTASDLEGALAALTALPHGRLALDLSGVTFLSSSGLRVLFNASKAEGAGGGEMRIFGLQPQVLKVFQLSGFDRVLTVVGTREEAAGGA